jgi:predicted dehydrogenase
MGKVNGQIGSPIGVAVVGCGYMGAEEARALAALPEARLAGVWNRTFDRAQALAAELGCVAHEHLEEMLDTPGLDAVVVATANHVHRKPVVAAAERGLHVFLEKPIALTVTDCDAMIDAASRAGVILLPGHSMRFHHGCQQMKAAIEAGRIGRPLVARSLRNTWTDLTGADSWKLRRAESGSDLFHHIHEIDLLLWMLGEVSSVFTRMANLAHPHLRDYDDAIFVSLQFASGVLAHMESGSAFRHAESQVVVGGDEGALILDMYAAQLALTVRGEAVETWPLFDDPESQTSLLEYAAMASRQPSHKVYGVPEMRPPLFLQHVVAEEMRHFVACVQGKEKPLMQPEEARQGVVVAAAGIASARAGQPVSLLT